MDLMEKDEHVYYKRQQKLYFRVMTWMAGWIYWLLCNTYFRLMPLTIINQGFFSHIDNQPLKGILAPWHSYIPYGFWMIRNRKGAAMISQSNFGTVAAAITVRMGCIPIRGGSRFGGERALTQLVNYVKKGHWGLIVADGPRGPQHVCKLGPVLAAQHSGRPLIPVSFAPKRKWILNTWDRTIIPKPFSPVLWMYGAPFYVPRDLDRKGLEAKRQELDRILRENHQKAEDYWRRGCR